MKIWKPLDTYTNVDTAEKEEKKLLQETMDNMAKLAFYGIHNLEKDFSSLLKSQEIILGDLYTIIPLSIKVTLPKRGPYYRAIATYLLEVLIEFDIVDEEGYLIGGSAYEEGRKRFEKE